MVRSNMAITFIHTADWHIGKGFGRFGTELGAPLRVARLNAIDRIAAHARNNNARHVLVAGDIWDQERPDQKTLVNTLERLGLADDVQWWLLPGNHDPARPNGLWRRIELNPAKPDNVHLVLTPEAIAIEDDVFLLPAPLLSKDAGRDLTAWMDACATPEGALRIGLAHGSIHGFGDGDDAAAVISASRTQTARLDYLALGDWHGKKQIDAQTWYPGTPEPDQFPRNEPGWCLCVHLDQPGAPPQVTALPTAEFTWLRHLAVVSPGVAPADLFDHALKGATTSQKTLLHFTVTGQIRSDAAALLNQEIKRYEDALAYLDVRKAELQILVETSDLDQLDHGGSLRTAGEQLLARADDQSLPDKDRTDARSALALLFTYAADSPSGGTS